MPFPVTALMGVFLCVCQLLEDGGLLCHLCPLGVAGTGEILALGQGFPLPAGPAWCKQARWGSLE
jgi:hypothetical protein